MTIKTWQERAEADPWGSQLRLMQEEIDELRATLDAWENQEPVAWLITDDRGYFASLQLFKPTALLSNETVHPLYKHAVPKEPS